MRLALLLLLLAGCASFKPHRDSPQYRACRAACEDQGASGASVFEDEDSAVCLCKKAPETASRIDWREVDREIALAAQRADLEIIIKRNREAFERGAR